MTVSGQIQAMGHRMLKPYRKMNKTSKVTFWIVLILHFVGLAVVLIITPKRIAQFFNDMALGLREMGWKGVLVVFACAIVSSHPPMFGFSATLSMVGFAWGVWKGFLLGSVAALTGSAIAFYSVRMFFLEWMKKFGHSKSKQWEAFGHVVHDKGWPLVAMIRWCPLPWAIGNGLFASIDSIEFWHYMLANTLYLPRLFIPIFIGARLGAMADNPEGDKADPLKFWLNLISIAASLVFSVVTGVLIYRLTLRQMRRMGNVEEGELAAAALEETALLGDYSGESGDEDEVEELVPPSHRNDSAV